MQNFSYGHHLATGSLANFLKLIQQNHGIDKRYIVRALTIFVSNLFLFPFQKFESLKWEKKIRNVTIQEPPIFIIGHWRTGSTYLHNLMSLDDNLGYISTLQSFCPQICLEGSHILWPIFRALLPPKRPMDNMHMALELPQEEEYAFANLSSYSFYVGYSFPRSMNAIFKSLSFHEKNENLEQAWQDVFITIMKKATLIMHGKRLVIKNPMHTLHIPILLSMFPEAKFIYLSRNPFIVFASTLRTFSVLINRFKLQDISESDIKENVFQFYDIMMKKYWATKKDIPAGNLVEIRFEEFEKETLTALEKSIVNLISLSQTKRVSTLRTISWRKRIIKRTPTTWTSK